MNKGWIKLHRKLMDWEWYRDVNCYKLFTHCLMKANYEDTTWQGKAIKKGDFLTSLNILAADTGLSVQEVRTAMKKLTLTKEIVATATNEGTCITVCNYDTYNSEEDDINTPSTSEATRGATTFKEDKKETTNVVSINNTKQDKTEQNEKSDDFSAYDDFTDEEPDQGGKLPQFSREDCVDCLYEKMGQVDGEPSTTMLRQQDIVKRLVSSKRIGYDVQYLRAIDQYIEALSVSLGSTKYRAMSPREFKRFIVKWIVKRYTGTYWELNLSQDVLAYLVHEHFSVKVSAEKKERTKLNAVVKTLNNSSVNYDRFLQYIKQHVNLKGAGILSVLYDRNWVNNVLQQYMNYSKLMS